MNDLVKTMSIVTILAMLVALAWIVSQVTVPKSAWTPVEGCRWEGRMGDTFTSPEFTIVGNKWRVVWSITGYTVINAYIKVIVVDAIGDGHPVVDEAAWTSEPSGELELTQVGAFQRWYVNVSELK